MKLIISGSSYLLPHNKAWHALGAGVDPVFAEYGDWSGTLLQSDPLDAVAVILFLDDLVDVRECDETGIEGLLDGFLALLKTRIGRARAPTIVGFAGCDRATVVHAARRESTVARVREWFFREAYALAAEYHHLYLIDLDRLFGTVGSETVLDPRNWYVAHCRLSGRGLAVVGEALGRIVTRHRTAAAKLLVLDCDNTLWGGVVGEDGLGNLVLGEDGLGRAFVDFQAAAKALSREGILLAVASKNEEADVLEVFDRHAAMVLGRGDIVAWRINWQDKALSIAEIAAEVDLGLDSVVFWDDNPLERDRVRRALPDVLTVDVPDDVCRWPRHLANLECFARFSITADDVKRTEQYHVRSRFVSDRNAAADEAAYLKSIRLTPTPHPLGPSLLARAAQLCAKTNQFNLRTARHTADDLGRLAALNPDLCFLTSLDDVYGAHGHVGLVCLRTLDADTLFLDTLLLSCRVLGRHLETWMLHHALAMARKHGYRTLLGEFIPSARNQVAARFLEAHGFTPLTPSDGEDETRIRLGGVTRHATSRLYSLPTAHPPLPHLDIYGLG
jgi:FkbH-like protein